ncbi:MAG: zinc ribbon domain-containing protein [Acidobacteria bacterium]|nr:zinc ribbon domain-containing protein [Acidobacteriota bacterium]
MGLREIACLGDTESVPDSCTCGAKLPPDARFCHKCAKPQFDEPVEETPEPVAPPTAAFAAQAPAIGEINFRNSVAVRVAFLAAGISSLLISLPMPMYVAAMWMFLWLFSAGFVAVFLYRRRTGDPVGLRGGARLGWITGIFCFAIATVFFTISVITISRQGGLGEFYRQQLSIKGPPDENVRQFFEILEHPTGLATVLLLSVFFLFILFTLLPTLGGMLGSKVLDRE